MVPHVANLVRDPRPDSDNDSDFDPLAAAQRLFRRKRLTDFCVVEEAFRWYPWAAGEGKATEQLSL